MSKALRDRLACGHQLLVTAGLAGLVWFLLPIANALADSSCSSHFVDRVSREIRSAYQQKKQPAPKWDPVLSRAAFYLSQKAEKDGIAQATKASSIAKELNRAGAWDPPPRTIALQTTPPEKLLTTVTSRHDLAASFSSHFGLGCTTTKGSAFAVVLFSNRKAVLSAFPRFLPRKGRATLSGSLLAPLHSARVWVTDPTLGVYQSPPDYLPKSRKRFKSTLVFPLPGRYTVEIIGQSEKGPQVAAIFRVQVGKPTSNSFSQPLVTPETDLTKAETQIWKEINKLRKSKGLAPLVRDGILDKIARAHCQEMKELGYFAHISPISGNAANRLQRANIRYRRVTENLGEAKTALEAHRLIEDSPGHLANILDPQVERIGIGTAHISRQGVNNVLLTEIFLKPGP